MSVTLKPSAKATDPKVSVVVPEPIHARIAAMANLNRRSLSGQALLLIEIGLETIDREPERALLVA